LSKPLRQAMLARDLDRGLGLPLRQVELASEQVQERGKDLREGEAVGVREAPAEGQPGLDPLQGTIGKAEEPKGPCGI
jgi:hypothetical protein